MMRFYSDALVGYTVSCILLNELIAQVGIDVAISMRIQNLTEFSDSYQTRL